jgi:hypothetical protein
MTNDDQTLKKKSSGRQTPSRRALYLSVALIAAPFVASAIMAFTFDFWEGSLSWVYEDATLMDIFIVEALLMTLSVGHIVYFWLVFRRCFRASSARVVAFRIAFTTGLIMVDSIASILFMDLYSSPF